MCLITGDPGDDRPLDCAVKDFLSSSIQGFGAVLKTLLIRHE